MTNRKMKINVTDFVDIGGHTSVTIAITKNGITTLRTIVFDGESHKLTLGEVEEILADIENQDKP